MGTPIRVLLVEDHALVRAGLRGLCHAMAGIEVVAEAADGHHAIAIAHEIQPDLMIADIILPRLNGFEVLARIKKELPSIKVLILSMYADEEHILHALHLGAAGYLTKEASPAELEVAVRAIIHGNEYLDPRTLSTVTNYLRRVHAEQSGEQAVQERNPISYLTPRQREILQLVAEGRSTKNIANLLKMKVKTVEVHRTQLMKRLDIHNTAGLVRYAIRHGIIDDT
ncbi:MAG: response regulator [Candidatus Binatia bacterium]